MSAVMGLASQRPFLCVSTLLFIASAAATISWGSSMSAMGGMPMPGGWTMSMTWMLMPGQTWSGAAASFVGMWVVMMVAMMLPSLVPMLERYRAAVGNPGAARLEWLTALAGLGYFAVWTALGIVAFPLGIAVAAAEMQHPALSRAVPIATGIVVLAAGAVQLTSWKARRLTCCRETVSSAMRPDAAAAWRHGLRLGALCCACNASLMAILFVVGLMDLRAMAAVGVVMTLERVMPAGERIARAAGAVIGAAGLFMLARAATLG
jgi:predicted metal-binding membrane protein